VEQRQQRGAVAGRAARHPESEAEARRRPTRGAQQPRAQSSLGVTQAKHIVQSAFFFVRFCLFSFF